jgi:hypothetical protein
MNSPNEVQRARNGYIWSLVAPFMVIATTLVIASMNFSYSICVGDNIDCGRNGAKYLNYLIGLIPSALWYAFLLPNAFHKESAFVRKHGRSALMLAGILWGVALLGLVIEWMMPLSDGTILNAIYAPLFVIWLFNILQLNNFIKENEPKKEDNSIKENSPKEENDLKSKNTEKPTTNPIWIIIVPVGLLAVLFFWSSLDYEAQGNFVMAGMVCLVAAVPILALGGWAALLSRFTTSDKKIDNKNKADEPSQPDAEADIKDKSE